MEERPTTREILSQTNQAFFGKFGKLVMPAVVAGFVGYCLNLLYTRTSHLMDLTVWRLAHRDVNAAVRAVVIPGIALQLVLFAVDLALWGVVFAIVARLVVPEEETGGATLYDAFRMLGTEAGWSRIWLGLYLRLILPGFLIKILILPTEIPFFEALHIGLTTPDGRLFSEVFTVLVFYTVFLIYARRWSLAIPLPIVAGDAPIDPFRDSAEVSKRRPIAIIVSCLAVWGISNFADQHLPPTLMAPGGIRPTVGASYAVYIAVALLTSVLWAWLFVFLTEIAIAENPAKAAASATDPEPMVVPNS